MKERRTDLIDIVRLAPSRGKARSESTTHGHASVTHYLQDEAKGEDSGYYTSAIGYLQEALEYKFEDQSTLIEAAESALQYLLFEVDRSQVPFPCPVEPDFTFIDLFAGIGGFRMAMQNLGGRCVFSSEWDSEAQRTYYANFGEYPFGDITNQSVKALVPATFDILCAGFPCQAFSIAGKRGGFDDTRGTLFFDVAEIIQKHRPKAVFLENVKGLKNHDGGKTLATILNVLRNDLGYNVPEPEVINARNFGVPQNRERIYIIGTRNDLEIEPFVYPKPMHKARTFGEIKESEVVSTKYYLSSQYLKTLVQHRNRHADKGNGFGFEIIPDDGVANAVVCGGMGRERNLVYDHRITDYQPVTKIKSEVNKEGIRKMTPREWARLQGFPDEFVIPVADASAYKQFGNSVAVPAIQATARQLIKVLKLIPWLK